jgi:uncharacterized delta-60 repeat protein
MAGRGIARAALGCLAAALGLSVAGPATAQGAAGFPDPAFGSGGFTVLDEPGAIHEQLLDVEVLPDGKILGAGFRGGSSGFLLARLNPDGSPDLGFGPGGIRVEPDTAAEGAPRGIEAIEPRADGKVVATGLSRGPGGVNAFGFARYLPSGALDPEFGSSGLRTVPIAPFGASEALALAPDQKVVAAGRSEDIAVVVRLTEGGDPDTTFNAAPAGIRLLDVPGGGGDEAHAVAVLGDGAILVGGITSAGGFLAKLSPTGEPNATFGDAGFAVEDLGTSGSPSGSIEDIEVLGDGSILVTGLAASAVGGSLLFVARFTPEGELDPSFGENGVFRRDAAGDAANGKALEVLPDGRIVVAGQLGAGPESGDSWILRLTPGGQVDPSFGNGGEATSSLAGFDAASGLAIQPDGRAVVAGAISEAGSQLLVGRFTADDLPPAPKPSDPPEPPDQRCGKRTATQIGTTGNDRLFGTK